MSKQQPDTAAGRALLDYAWPWLGDLDIDEWRDRILAIEAEAAAGTALDVERLARALEALWRKRWGTEPSKGTVTWNGAWAEDIAAAYQREEGA